MSAFDLGAAPCCADICSCTAALVYATKFRIHQGVTGGMHEMLQAPTITRLLQPQTAAAPGAGLLAGGTPWSAHPNTMQLHGIKQMTQGLKPKCPGKADTPPPGAFCHVHVYSHNHSSLAGLHLSMRCGLWGNAEA